MKTSIIHRALDRVLSAFSLTQQRVLRPTWAYLYGDDTYGTDSGERVTGESALGVSAVYACVDLISRTVSTLPLQVFRRLPRGRETASDHYLYRLLHDAPNEEQTSATFRQVLAAHVLLHGNAFAYIGRDQAYRPSQLIALNPVDVEVRRQGGQLDYLHLPTQRRIPAYDMIHVLGLSMDGLTGLSVLRHHAETVGWSQAARKFSASFFRNGGRPSLAVQHPALLSDNAAKRLRDGVQKLYGGAGNAGRVLVLEEGAKADKLTITPDEAQFIETMGYSGHEIARIFRVPPHLIGYLDRATFSNIEEQSIEFVTHTIRPWLVRFEQEFNRKLISAAQYRDHYIEHRVDGLLRGNTQQRSQFYREMFNIGVFSSNDIRELENLAPYDGGDRYFVPSTMLPTDKIDARYAQQPPPNPAPGEEAPPPPGDGGRAARPLLLDLAGRIVRKDCRALRRVWDKAAAEHRQQAVWDQLDKMLPEQVDAASPAAVALRTLGRDVDARDMLAQHVKRLTDALSAASVDWDGLEERLTAELEKEWTHAL